MGIFRLKSRIGLPYEIEDCDGLVHVSRNCVFCGNYHTVELELSFTRFMERWNKWLHEVTVQDAFPDADEDTREFLISSICPTCFSIGGTESDASDMDASV